MVTMCFCPTATISGCNSVVMAERLLVTGAQRNEKDGFLPFFARELSAEADWQGFGRSQSQVRAAITDDDHGYHQAGRAQACRDGQIDRLSAAGTFVIFPFGLHDFVESELSESTSLPAPAHQECPAQGHQAERGRLRYGQAGRNLEDSIEESVAITLVVVRGRRIETQNVSAMCRCRPFGGWLPEGRCGGGLGRWVKR